MVPSATWCLPCSLLLDTTTQQQRNEHDYSVQLDKLKQKMMDPLATNGPIVSNLKKAQKQLCDVCQQAATQWLEFLEFLLQTEKLIGNGKKKNLPLCLAELNWKCFAHILSILKSQSPGGLTHFLIPDATSPTDGALLITLKNWGITYSNIANIFLMHKALLIQYHHSQIY